MAVEIFQAQVSRKECAGRGDRTRGRLHAKRTRFRSSTALGLNPFRKLLRIYCILHNKNQFTNSSVLKIQHTRDIQYLSEINLDVSPYKAPDLTLGTKYMYTAEY